MSAHALRLYVKCGRCHTERVASRSAEGYTAPLGWRERTIEGFWHAPEAEWQVLLCVDCAKVVDGAMTAAWAHAIEPLARAAVAEAEGSR